MSITEVRDIDNEKLKRIHINKHIMLKNRRHNTKQPAIGVEVSAEAKHYAHQVSILGPSTVIHNQDKPLKCGARCWVETRAPIQTRVIIDAEI